MADEHPTSASGRVPAADVARRSFGTVRRGFDPEEVRAYLELVSRELLAAERREQELLHDLAEAEDRARHPVIDEAVLSSSLGQRSAAVLRSAHEEAARIVQGAETSAASLMREAQLQATETEVRAESSAAERIAEAELAANALRQQARDESAAMIEAARAEGEALVERAREHGRTMVEQAQEARRRVLADMAHRRRLVTDQIEQFRAARDEIAGSVVGVRHSVDRIIDDLSRADEAARAAAADAARHQGASIPEAVLIAEGEQAAADLGTAGREAPADPLRGRGSPGASGSGGGGGGGSRHPSAGGGDVELGAVELEVENARVAERRVTLRFDDVASVVEPRGGHPTEPDDAARATGSATGSPGSSAPGSSAPGSSVAGEAPLSGPGVGADLGEHPIDQADVEGLFARLRARQAQEDAPHPDDLDRPAHGTAPPGAHGAAPPGAHGTAPPGAHGTAPPGAHGTAPPSAHGGADGEGAGLAAADAPPPGEGRSDLTPPQGTAAVRAGRPAEDPDAAEESLTATEEPGEPDADGERSPDQVALDERAAALDPIVTALARRLKRALQDDQNRLLDHVRKGTGEWEPDVLPEESAHRAQYVKASSAQIRDALAAGIAFARTRGRPSRAKAPAPDPATVEAVADDLSTTVVTLLRRRLERGDSLDAVERIGAAYREWRGERIEHLAEDRAIEAFSSGVLAGAVRSPSVRWVRGEGGPGCADCEDNVLAGAVPTGEEFPTGHRYPPAHAGCRCLVLPTPA